MAVIRLQQSATAIPERWDEDWNVITEADPDNINKLLITGVGGAGSGPIKATLDLQEMTITLAPGQALGDVYGYGNISVYKGTDGGDDIIEDEPLMGVIPMMAQSGLIFGGAYNRWRNAGMLWDDLIQRGPGSDPERRLPGVV